MSSKQDKLSRRIKIQRHALLVGFCLLFATWLTIGLRSATSNSYVAEYPVSNHYNMGTAYTVETIQKLNTAENSFEASGTIKEKQSMNAPNTEDNPFENARAFKITQTRVRNGVRVSKFLATFEGSKFDFRRFPYETGELRIALNASRSRDGAQILFNVNQESLPKGLNAHTIDYGVGDTKETSNNSKQILISVVQVNHARFAKLMVPLLTVLTISVAGLLVSPKNYEPRLGLPATAILVLVFLQDRYSNLLPDSMEYTTLMDRLYIISFVVIIAIFMETVSTGNKWLHSETGKSNELADKLLDSGRIYAILLLYSLIGIGLFI